MDMIGADVVHFEGGHAASVFFVELESEERDGILTLLQAAVGNGRNAVHSCSLSATSSVVPQVNGSRSPQVECCSEHRANLQIEAVGVWHV